MASDVDAVISDLDAETRAVRALVTESDLAQPTRAAGWTVSDTVRHLLSSDQAATVALRDPERFKLERSDPARRTRPTLPASSSDALLTSWYGAQDLLIEALRLTDPSDRVDWFGPSMSLRSFASARIMEYWAHGEDMADAVGRQLAATDRLRNVCHLGVATRAFSFAVHSESVPSAAVFVSLVGPRGDTWTWGDRDAPESVTGSARDFCLVVTQRHHVEQTHLHVRGPGAIAWMRLAQAFAGRPTTTAEDRRAVSWQTHPGRLLD